MKPADQSASPLFTSPLQQQQQPSAALPYGTPNVSDMSYVVRQTAQSLMQRWSRGDDSEQDTEVIRTPAHNKTATAAREFGSPPFFAALFRSAADTPAAREHHHHHRGGASHKLQMSDVVPSRWDELLCADSHTMHHHSGGDSATATITSFQSGTSGAPLLWNVIVRPELLVTNEAGMESRRASIAGEQHRLSTSPGASMSQIETYGLSEKELRYFGLMPEEGDNRRRTGGVAQRTPKEILLAQLRAPVSNSLGPSPKDNRPSKRNHPSNELDEGGVIIGLPRPKIVIHNIAPRQKPSPSSSEQRTRSPVDARATSLSSLEESTEDAQPHHHHHRHHQSNKPQQQGERYRRPLSPPIVLPPAAAAAALMALPSAASLTEDAPVPISPSKSPTNRPRGRSFLSTTEKPLNERFKKPGHCDATSIESLMHMHALTKAIMSQKAGVAAGRRTSEIITSIDCSGTRLSRQAKFAIPTSFARDGNPIWSPRRNGLHKKRRAINEDGDDDLNNSTSNSAAGLADIGFWPDEQVVLREQRLLGSNMSFDGALHRQVVLNAVAERSLVLGYLAPLLFLRGGSRCRITTLIAQRCDLNDSDAIGLATILRCPSLNEQNATNYECHLTHVDLSENSITDEGATALKKAIKYNLVITELLLRENPIRNEKGVLNDIKRRLRNNKNGVSNLGLVARMMK
ncbi:Hypothetical protein, putative [Bodo saltans]|uniref:Leucine-rich repeat protein n=1 Tax=Bodo saltans TaxID=75058 RepID=A0A0S4JSG7_BODSA|nr:Hypothetical protein, putative [Bodo saltans]|eukprot:CUG94464.1 Hypothetical protein, putative [Bodo saltans]